MTRFPLTPADRRELLDHYRRSAEPDARLRSHILLLLDDGHPWATTRAVLFCSLATIGRWKTRFEADGVDAVFGRPRGRRKSGIHIWATLVVRWVLNHRCRSMDELLDLTFDWFETRTHFRVETDVYNESPGKCGLLQSLAGGI